MRPDDLCGLLAETDRLRIFAAVVLGAQTPAAVRETTGLPLRTVIAGLRRLASGGLVSTVDGALRADSAAFKDAVRERAPDSEQAGSLDASRPRPAQFAEQAGSLDASHEPLDADRQRAAVLRAFLADGKLTQIPAAHAKRRIVLEHIVTVFEPGAKYPERTVDAILRAWHPDHAALRRYLVDEDLMARENGVYWRTGGYVDV
jgi:hypothetical protein